MRRRGIACLYICTYFFGFSTCHSPHYIVCNDQKAPTILFYRPTFSPKTVLMRHAENEI